jgi:RHS repeat-associated protein
MPGDRFTLSGDGYYEGSEMSEPAVSGDKLAQSLLTSLAGGTAGGIPVAELEENRAVLQQAIGAEHFAAMTDLLHSPNTDPGRPASHLNYMVLDESFMIQKDQSGARQIMGDHSWTTVSVDGDIHINQAGYLLVFTSNSANRVVFWDRIALVQYTGSIVEENHYYPFGLTLSSSAAGTIPQPYKYQTKELEKLFGLEMYDFGARMMDPQLGKTRQLDPHADRYTYISPYVSMNNNPVSYIDPDGKDARVSYHQDKSGNTTITLSSTIYVRGYNEKAKTDDYNQFLKDNPQLLTNTTRHDNGTTTTINIQMDYKVATQEDVIRLTNPETRNGDNLMNIAADYGRSNASPKTVQRIDPITGVVQTEKFTDYQARLGGKDKHYGSSKTAFHESMHLFGLRDWYNNGKDQSAVGFFDMMNNHSSTNRSPILHQIHWSNWKNGIGQQRKQNGEMNNFILNRMVESD